MRTKTLDPAILDEIIRRVVEVAEPDKIILFGSAARNEMGPNSDLDLLVVKSGNIHRRKLADNIRHALRGVEAAFDIIVVGTEDVQRYGDCPYTVIYPALREGKVIYAT